MIGVEEKERIRRAYFVKHRSIRWITRNYHRSRTTVRKADWRQLFLPPDDNYIYRFFQKNQ